MPSLRDGGHRHSVQDDRAVAERRMSGIGGSDDGERGDSSGERGGGGRAGGIV